jgi:predicted transcriptional regulator of viral defense system
MNHPPASARDYWDRILKLAKDNGGSFTLDQIQEEFDLSSREMKKIAKRVERKPAYDAVDNYEFAEDTVKGWGADTIPEERAEKEKSSPDLQRIEGLGELWLMARREFKFVDIDDEEAVQAIRLKYSTLNQIFIYLNQKGDLYGWF